MNPEFETEEYKFWFKEGKVDRRLDYIQIEHVSGRDVTDKDVDKLSAFFDDIGKWELLIKSVNSLLKDLGIELKINKRYEKDFGKEKYEIKCEKDIDAFGRIGPFGEGKYIIVKIRLTPEEGAINSLPSKEEILKQVKNIPKWKSLIKTTLALGLPLLSVQAT